MVTDKNNAVSPPKREAYDGFLLPRRQKYSLTRKYSKSELSIFLAGALAWLCTCLFVLWEDIPQNFTFSSLVYFIVLLFVTSFLFFSLRFFLRIIRPSSNCDIILDNKGVEGNGFTILWRDVVKIYPYKDNAINIAYIDDYLKSESRLRRSKDKTSREKGSAKNLSINIDRLYITGGKGLNQSELYSILYWCWCDNIN